MKTGAASAHLLLQLQILAQLSEHTAGHTEGAENSLGEDPRLA